MTLTAGISIDWDFFIPEDPMWDLGHCETLLHLKLLWQHRGNLIDLMKTTGAEKEFWKALQTWAKYKGQLTVSESHAFVLDDHDVMMSDLIVLFDQHHDCWPLENKREVGCHNWARAWLEADDNRQLIWVMPDWLDAEIPDPPKDLPNFKAVHHNQFLPGVLEAEVTSIHVCRSGCWTPPWLDEQFKQFLVDSGLETLPLQEGDWDPFEPRWSEKDLQAARDFQKQFDEMRNGLNEDYARLQRSVKSNEGRK